MDQNLQIQINSARSDNSRQEPLYQEFKKVDILFYDSVNLVKRNFMLMCMYQFAQAVMLLVFMPLDKRSLNPEINNSILNAMIIAIVATLLQSLQSFLFRCTALGDTLTLLILGQKMGHSTQQVFQSAQSFDQCVSTSMYNQQNETLISNQGLTPEIKKRYSGIMSAQILEHLKLLNPCLSRWQVFLSWYGFAAIIYAIVVISTQPKTSAQLAVLIVFIILQSFSKIPIIVLCLVICLIPVLCIFCCFCKCFCDKNQQASQLPNAQPATQEIINQAGGNCSICFQNFIVGSQVIKLKCSPKHVFHPICIGGWAKVRSSCPMCRKSFGQ